MGEVWMGLGQDVRYGVRQMMRAPVFAVTAVLTLALGIGANTAIFTVFNQVLLRMLPVERPRELVQVKFIGSDSGHMSSFGGDQSLYFSNRMYRDLREKNTVFGGLLANVETSAGLVWKDKGEVADVEMVSGNYFDVLGVKPQLGRVLKDADDREKNGSAVLVLSYAYWTTRFAADRGVLNQTVQVNGHPFTIVGVAAANFSSVIGGFKPAVFVPITMEPVVTPGRDYLDDRRSRWLNVVGRLKPGVSAATAQAALTVLWKQIRAGELAEMKYLSAKFADRFVAQSSVVLVDDSKGFSPLRDGLRTPLLVLMGMVGLLAAMTCMNLTSLLLVRGAGRGREFAVRYALGAGRGRVLRQMLVEGLMLGLVGGGIGLAVAPLAAELLVRRVTDATGEIAFRTTPDGWVLGFNLLLSLGVSVIVSMVPALEMLKPDTTEGMRQKAGTGLGSGQRLRTIAMGMQIGLSVLLLSGAGLFVRTLQELKGQRMGMVTDHVVRFSLNPTLAGYDSRDSLGVHERVSAALAGLPGVRAVGGTTDAVLGDSDASGNVTVEGYAPTLDEDMNVELPMVTPGYFASLGIPIVMGRDFTEADREGAAKVAVVSRGFAVKYFGGPEKALGHLLTRGGAAVKLDTQIVGVVEDAKHKIREGAAPTLYQAYAQNAGSNKLTSYVRTAQAPEAAEHMVVEAVRGVDAKLIANGIKTMEEQIDDSLSNERMIALLAACFAVIALVTTAVGLYGVLAYATAQRTREIGIRMALGAQRGAVVRLVLGSMGKVAGVAIVLALPVAVGLGRMARSQMFGVSPFDPVVLVGCVVVTAAMVLVAAAVPARRAATVEPTEALRAE